MCRYVQIAANKEPHKWLAKSRLSRKQMDHLVYPCVLVQYIIHVIPPSLHPPRHQKLDEEVRWQTWTHFPANGRAILVVEAHDAHCDTRHASATREFRKTQHLGMTESI